MDGLTIGMIIFVIIYAVFSFSGNRKMTWALIFGLLLFVFYWTYIRVPA